MSFLQPQNTRFARSRSYSVPNYPSIAPCRPRRSSCNFGASHPATMSHPRSRQLSVQGPHRSRSQSRRRSSVRSISRPTSVFDGASPGFGRSRHNSFYSGIQSLSPSKGGSRSHHGSRQDLRGQSDRFLVESLGRRIERRQTMKRQWKDLAMTCFERTGVKLRAPSLHHALHPLHHYVFSLLRSTRLPRLSSSLIYSFEEERKHLGNDEIRLRSAIQEAEMMLMKYSRRLSRGGRRL